MPAKLLSWALFCLVFMVCGVCPASAATLQLSFLRCRATEDTVGSDECELTITADGVQVERLFKRMKAGKVWDLDSVQVDFRREVVVRLYDLDSPSKGDDHDLLGTATITAETTCEGLARFREDGANYELTYVVSESEAPSAETGRAFLTIASETGMPHAVWMLEFPDGTQKWYGFKPQEARSLQGPGLLDKVCREGFINHYVRIEVQAAYLAKAEKLMQQKYCSAEYCLGRHDCVSLAADAARACQLRVPSVNLLPYGLISSLRDQHTCVNYDDKPYPWCPKSKGVVRP